jgi:CDP-glucose 4,6-dehydratase
MDKSFWKDRNIFVTGCTGLLGSWMCKYLTEYGSHVTGLIRDRVPRSKLISDGSLDKINTVYGELEDYRLIERSLGEYEIDTVIHLGAQTIVGIANRNPLSTFESNIKGTWNVLEACRRSPTVKNVLIASSDKAYGDQEILPYTESMPLQGKHPYDVSKSCADLISQSYFHTYGLNVCISRCGNFFGGGDLNFNRIIPGTIRSVLNNERPIIRSDGSFIRDYIYIEDGVLAYMTIAENMSKSNIGGESFNFSTEAQITVVELVERILKLMRSDLKPVVLNEASNEIKHQYLCTKKSREMLNWKPAFSLDESLERTIGWYRLHF